MAVSFRKWCLAGLAAVFAACAQGQSAYPVKPVRVIVPLAAGGSTDNNGRLMAEKLGQALGVSFFVENRVGAATDIGIGTLAKSAPDGYTIGVVPLGSVATGILLRKLPYDPFKDIAPIGGISKGALVIVVAASSPYQTLADLIATAKAKPGFVSFGSIGIGSSHHLAGELLKQMTGTDMLHVPFKGASESNIAVLGGQIESSISGSSSIASQVRAGKTAQSGGYQWRASSTTARGALRRRIRAGLFGGGGDVVPHGARRHAHAHHFATQYGNARGP